MYIYFDPSREFAAVLIRFLSNEGEKERYLTQSYGKKLHIIWKENPTHIFHETVRLDNDCGPT